MKRAALLASIAAHVVGLGVVAVWWAKGAALKVRDRLLVIAAPFRPLGLPEIVGVGLAVVVIAAFALWVLRQ